MEGLPDPAAVEGRTHGLVQGVDARGVSGVRRGLWQPGMVDFDLGGEAFAVWRDAVEASSPGLIDRLVIESTPSGGRHVVYRCESSICGNTSSPASRIDTDGPGDLVVGSKKNVTPRQDPAGRWHIVVTLIETRGEGGMFLCAPSESAIDGATCAPSGHQPDERDVLLGCRGRLDGTPRLPVVDGPCPLPGKQADSHGACGAASGRAMSTTPGATFVTSSAATGGRSPAGSNEHWRRPGKSAGTNATLKDGVFYVFSSNAPPFEPQQGYAAFAVYAMLEHGGDWSKAASTLPGRRVRQRAADIRRGPVGAGDAAGGPPRRSAGAGVRAGG